ncbi:acetyl-CoA hydrolase/transferase family protein [Marmoricola sp. RAF53]|uniref:acetyl-CoA hydrolase/transferase family protein n=1 Tax=Marmoricola sp. RAF53 TaxID=3233059 RepID=UPI003F94672A
MRNVSEAELASILGALGEWHTGQDGEPLRVVVSGNAARPEVALGILDEQVASYRLFVLNAHPPIPARDGVVHETAFVGPAMRHSESLSYVPARLSLVPHLFATTLPPDVVIVHTTPAAPDGRLSLGIEVNILPGAIEACRARGGVVIAQADPAMPYTFGDAVLDPDLVDYVLEAGSGLGGPPPRPAADELSGAIADAAAARVLDGATLQTGIGAIPDAVLARLGSHRQLRVWSEMFSDGVLDLAEHGCLDENEPVIASFVLGSPAVYSWVDRNPAVRLMRTELVNSPARIALNPRMVSINTALQVDLFGQANASRIGARIYSGFGGQTDFIVGALHAPEGQALMTLASWHPKADVSTIVDRLSAPVTSFQHTAVITENGVAEMYGRDERTQASNLIERAAHPRVREALWEAAAAFGLR